MHFEIILPRDLLFILSFPRGFFFLSLHNELLIKPTVQRIFLLERKRRVDRALLLLDDRSAYSDNRVASTGRMEENAYGNGKPCACDKFLARVSSSFVIAF